MNIIEAVEYLKKNPSAVITRDGGGIRLHFNAYDDPLSNNSTLNINDILMDWTVEKPIKLQRTHAEIMRNWFKSEHGEWLKVGGYQTQNSDFNEGYLFSGKHYFLSYFNTLEMKTQEEMELIRK
jgi:hypothetical protein